MHTWYKQNIIIMDEDKKKYLWSQKTHQVQRQNPIENTNKKIK